MKTLTVQEAHGQLGQLIAEANRGDVIMLTNGVERVTLTVAEYLDPEEDPALGAELLKCIDGPYSLYSSDEMRAFVERIIREEKRG
jgi:hypothetical protein